MKVRKYNPKLSKRQVLPKRKYFYKFNKSNENFEFVLNKVGQPRLFESNLVKKYKCRFNLRIVIMMTIF